MFHHNRIIRMDFSNMLVAMFQENIKLLIDSLVSSMNAIKLKKQRWKLNFPSFFQARRDGFIPFIRHHDWIPSAFSQKVSARQIRGLDESASDIGQANRFQLKLDLHLGKFHRANYFMRALQHQLSCVGAGIVEA